MSNARWAATIGLVALIALVIAGPGHNAQETPEPAPETETTAEATAEITVEATAEVTAEATGLPDFGDANACPALVQRALRLTRTGCEGTQLNQACYGHVVLDAEPRPGVQTFDFDNPGDIVEVLQLQSLRLSAMDIETGRWGMMLMEVQARLSEAANGQAEDVQLVLFGDVELEDRSHFVPLEILADVTVHSKPDPDSPVLQTLEAGQSVIANRRLEDTSWLRVRLADELGGIGWVRTEDTEPEYSLAELEPISLEQALADTPDELAEYGPMQAFFFRSGSDDALCPEAPESGMLIQTPEGAASVSIWMDEIVFDIKGTGYIRARPDGQLTLDVLDGFAQVSAQGETRGVPEGYQLAVPLDEAGLAADVPGSPAPYNDSGFDALPLELLEEPVTAAAPGQLAPGVPQAGGWLFEWNTDLAVCPGGREVPFENSGIPAPIVPQDEGLLYGDIQYTQTSPGVYSASYVDENGNLHQNTLQVIAVDRIEGDSIIDLRGTTCSLSVGFTLRLVDAQG